MSAAVVAIRAQIKPPIADTHVSFDGKIRRDWDSIKALARQADSVMSGPSASVTKANTLDALLAAIASQATALREHVR